MQKNQQKEQQDNEKRFQPQYMPVQFMPMQYMPYQYMMPYYPMQMPQQREFTENMNQAQLNQHQFQQQQQFNSYQQQYPFQPFNYSQSNFFKKQIYQPTDKSENYNDKHSDQLKQSFYQDKNQNNWKKPDPYKNKSAEQIVNEFKSQTLPKLRLKRLIKLQAVMKGYHTRKFKIPRKKVMNSIIENYVDKLIRHTIEDKIIPDLVIEIMAYNKYNEDVTLYSTEYRAHLEIMDRIIIKVIRDQVQMIVREATDNLVTKDEEKPKEEKDPFVLIVQDIIINSIKDECQIMAKQCINELSNEYLNEIQIRQIIKERFVTKSVQEVVIDSIEEVIVESLIDDMCEKLTKELAYPLATHIYDQIQQEVEAVELDKALDNYVIRGMFDIALEQICVMIDEKNKQKKDIELRNNVNQDFLSQMKSQNNNPH